MAEIRADDAASVADLAGQLPILPEIGADVAEMAGNEDVRMAAVRRAQRRAPVRLRRETATFWQTSGIADFAGC